MTIADTLQRYETEAAPICGWPEWQEGDLHYRLVHGVCGWAVDCIPPPYDDDAKFMASELHDHISEHVALCLWRDRCREYAAKRHWYIAVGTTGGVCYVAVPGSRIAPFADYDDALIAAVKEMKP
ncbi:MAG: hypothetical protein WC683_06910 [bacterium]